MTAPESTNTAPQPAVGAQVQRPVGPHRVPTRAEVERLMKRCQIGVGPRQMGEAHDIMAECYGTLGLLMSCVEFFHARATCECGDEFSAHYMKEGDRPYRSPRQAG